MDGIRQRSTAGIIAVAAIVAAAFWLGRCSAPNAAAAPSREAAAVELVDYVGYDLHTNAGSAIAELDAFLTSITTTTTVARITPSVTPNFDPGDGSMWDRLAQCESGGNWAYPPVAGGFSGGLMFHIGTWRAMGGQEFAPDAYLASREQQIEIAERTKAAAGGSMRPWPGCSRKFGWL